MSFSMEYMTIEKVFNSCSFSFINSRTPCSSLYEMQPSQHEFMTNNFTSDNNQNVYHKILLKDNERHIFISNC